MRFHEFKFLLGKIPCSIELVIHHSYALAIQEIQYRSFHKDKILEVPSGNIYHILLDINYIWHWIFC